jgi:MFS family permease
MDMTIVNVALPDMSNDLDAGIGELQWVLDAFLVSLAGLLLVGSGLADRFGRRRVFLSGFVGFAAASVLTAASQTVGEVIAARALMGVAAACVLPPALLLLAVLFPPELRPKALGVWSAVAGLGLALGPVPGGVLVEVAGSRWVFLVNVPFVLLAAPLAARVAPAGAPPLDLPGVALLTVAQTGCAWTSSIRRASLLRLSASGGTANWSTCSPSSEGRQMSSFFRLRSSTRATFRAGPPRCSFCGTRRACHRGRSLLHGSPWRASEERWTRRPLCGRSGHDRPRGPRDGIRVLTGSSRLLSVWGGRDTATVSGRSSGFSVDSSAGLGRIFPWTMLMLG